MKSMWLLLAASLVVVLFGAHTPAMAQDDGEPAVGKKAADSYFQKRRKTYRKGARGSRAPSSSPSRNRRPSSVGAPRYLQLHLGTFVNEDAYAWGSKANDDDLGKLTMGVTYRMGEWENSMDFLFRIDFNTFELAEGSASKMSLMPMIVFPDVNSGFPMYFGGGLGIGAYFKQIDDESSLSFDYTLVAGARFFDLIDTTGLSFEVGLKNHLHLLSDGQYNSVFAAFGLIFAF